MLGTKEMRTARLLLRRHVEADAKPLHEGFGKDPAMFEYSGWNPYESLDMAEKTVAELIAGYDEPRSYAWAIEHGGRLVGTIGAYDFDAEKNAIEIGMSIEKASWGKGFATEALAAVLHYLAEEEKVATIAAWCASDNIGSRRAMEKAGMVKVKTEKDALTVGDATFDKLWYEFRGEGAEKDA
ncbi:MAG: GNAT family N-acetyltransferase [Eggerthellaceae bacterium]|nr:GNAT family N-acetyltransferase [Eggerthellaceae bacterium]